MFNEMIALMDKGLGIRTVPGHYPGALITLHPRYDTTLPLPFYDGAAN
jgi:hypothetical protein